MRPPGGGAVEVALKGLIGPGGRRGRRSEWIHQIRPNKDAPPISVGGSPPLPPIPCYPHRGYLSSRNMGSAPNEH